MANGVLVGIIFCVLASGMCRAYNYADFKRNALYAHNKARSQHVDTPDLVWDDQLRSDASKHATSLMFKNLRSTSTDPSASIIDHSQYNVGENIYWGHNGQYQYTERTSMDAVSAWYREGVHYDYNQYAPYGWYWHFTQVVWKSTTKVGCGSSSYTKFQRRYTIIVCQYLAKGNISIGFLRNVKPLKPGGKSSLSVAELTAPRPSGGPCPYTDTAPNNGCQGMKEYCNHEYMKFLQTDCKKTCFC